MSDEETIWLNGRAMDRRNVLIAKACGWVFHSGSFNGSTTVSRPGNGYATTEEIPSYLSDLNAMHEAIRSRTIDEQWAIFATLANIVDADLPAYMGTPAQYAEAFLKTLNLWTP